MPLIGQYHTFYWESSDTTPAPKIVSRGGYPGFQAAVITPSLLGIFGAWIDTKMAQLKWWWRLHRGVAAIPPSQRQRVCEYVVRVQHGLPDPVVTKYVPQIIEKPVEKIVERVVEQIVEKPVEIEKIVEKTVTLPATPLDRRIRKLDPVRQALAGYVIDLAGLPAFEAALTAVDECAHTLGFNRPEAWIPYSRMLKSDPGRAQDVFRHVKAMERTRELANSTLTNPEANLLVELAYHVYAKPWTKGH